MDATRVEALGAMPMPPFWLSRATTVPSTEVPCHLKSWFTPWRTVIPAPAVPLDSGDDHSSVAEHMQVIPRDDDHEAGQ